MTMIATEAAQGGLLVVIYWILLLFIAIGAFAPPTWTYAPRASWLVTLVLFVIIGIKILKPAL